MLQQIGHRVLQQYWARAAVVLVTGCFRIAPYLLLEFRDLFAQHSVSAATPTLSSHGAFVAISAICIGKVELRTQRGELWHTQTPTSAKLGRADTWALPCALGFSSDQETLMIASRRLSGRGCNLRGWRRVWFPFCQHLPPLLLHACNCAHLAAAVEEQQVCARRTSLHTAVL